MRSSHRSKRPRNTPQPEVSPLTFQHPPPVIYWTLSFIVVFAALLSGIAELRDLTPTTGFFSGSLRIATPVAIHMLLFCFAMGLLGWSFHRFAEFRPGNRVRISRGDQAGAVGVVDSSTDRRPAAPLSVRLDSNDTVVKVTRYDAEKQGLWSWFF